MTIRRIVALAAFNVVALLFVVALTALSSWQTQRRAWKLDLIARIDARVHADAVAAPSKDRWADISAAEDEYRRVIVRGRWLDARPALVKAVTELGEGYWVMSALARDDGTTVLVNRGFVPADKRTPAFRDMSSTVETVTGKLRLSEPGGGFLRSNDPASDRWFSRDVVAIARARGLSGNAPYFIDAERTSVQGELPVAGLTVVSFSNNHLAYALTWAALALMTAAGTIFVNLDILRKRRLTRRVAVKAPA